MYNLLIIDDEPVITNFLYEIFSDYCEIEFNVFKAYSGYEALEHMNRNRIDIVLTDINMPGMNGLEVHKKIIEQWPQCKVIFLSGYNEFEYVHSAIRQGSIDYVLKTEGEDKIIAAVIKAVKEIEKENSYEVMMQKASQSLQKALPLLQESFFSELIQGGTYSDEYLAKAFQELEIKLSHSSPVILLMGKIDAAPAGAEKTFLTQTMYKVREISASYLRGSCIYYTAALNKNRIIWFIQPLFSAGEHNNFQNESNSEIWNRTIIFVRGTMASIQERCEQLLGVSLSFSFSSEPVSWNNVSRKAESLLNLLNKQWGISKGAVLVDDYSHDQKLTGISDDEGTDEYDNYDAVLNSIKKAAELEDYIESGDKQGFLERLEQIMDIVSSQDVTYDIQKQVYYSIATMYLSSLNRWRLVSKARENIDIEKLMNMEEHGSWDNVKIYFRQIADFIFEERNTDAFIRANKILQFIKNYVEEHINEDLSLTKLGEMLHFHPFYLSRMFKQVTGKNLTEYISQVKLRKAKEMLQRGEIRINEVASALGFETASYFTRFFKKYTGMTPNEYRESVGVEFKSEQS